MLREKLDLVDQEAKASRADTDAELSHQSGLQQLVAGLLVC